MDCPSCGSASVKGCILGDRYHLKWLPESRNVLSKVWAEGGIRVSEPRGPLGLGRPAMVTYYCEDCKLMFLYTEEARINHEGT